MTANCTTGCPTPGVHRSWGECLREKGATVAWANSANSLDRSDFKRTQDDARAFWDAHKHGIRPEGSHRRQVDAAVKWSDKHGQPYRARGRENG